MRIGKVKEQILQRSIWKISRQGKRADTEVLTTDAVITTRCAHPGRYGVLRALNHLAAEGGIPKMVTLQILLPPEAKEQEIREIMQDADRICRERGIFIGGGHTEVTRALNRTLVSVTATGIRAKKPGNILEGQGSVNTPQPEDALIVTKWVALEAMSLLLEADGAGLSDHFSRQFLDQAGRLCGDAFLSVVEDAGVAIAAGAGMLQDISSGGIFAALWRLADRCGLGLEVDLTRIPVRQETIEILNALQLSPYGSLSGGALLLTARDPKGVLAALGEKEIPAVIIGHLTRGNQRIIRNRDEVRYLDLPQAEEMLKVLG